MSPYTLDPLQVTVDEVVSAWPRVHGKLLFGHRAWVRTGTVFGFAAEGGIAVKAFSPEFAKELYARDDVGPFTYGDGTPSRNWPVVPLASEAQLEEVLTLLSRAYDAVG